MKKNVLKSGTKYNDTSASSNADTIVASTQCSLPISRNNQTHCFAGFGSLYRKIISPKFFDRKAF
jgi:hypothetical protein